MYCSNAKTYQKTKTFTVSYRELFLTHKVKGKKVTIELIKKWKLKNKTFKISNFTFIFH